MLGERQNIFAQNIEMEHTTSAMNGRPIHAIVSHGHNSQDKERERWYMLPFPYQKLCLQQKNEGVYVAEKENCQHLFQN